MPRLKINKAQMFKKYVNVWFNTLQSKNNMSIGKT